MWLKHAGKIPGTLVSRNEVFVLENRCDFQQNYVNVYEYLLVPVLICFACHNRLHCVALKDVFISSQSFLADRIAADRKKAQPPSSHK